MGDIPMWFGADLVLLVASFFVCALGMGAGGQKEAAKMGEVREQLQLYPGEDIIVV